jgi:hypothetical protein
MSKARLILLALLSLSLVSAMPALSTQELAIASEASKVAALRLVQCSLSGGCVQAGHILGDIEGVEEVVVYPTVSEFDVEYDPSRTTPDQIAESFNRDNPGSRVEIIDSSSASKSNRHQWCSYRSKKAII